ncbi:MAG: hypothetical protein NTV32_09915 [Gammaproteobacteria bacterium]|nr:hypothetical protein [Gammaproteobacteria bacterium]
MSRLGKLTLPYYTMIMPSTAKEIKFRPFVVKEEKLLLIALQSKDTLQINNALREIILSCTDSVLDTKEICTADSEYAFIKIRAKSIGEEIKPEITCGNCKKQTTIKMKLDDIEICNVEKNKETAFELSEKCIVSIIIKDEIINVKELDKNELSDFVNNLLPDQFIKIMEFFKNIPELKYTIDFPCPHCKERMQLQIKSVSDFFH